MTVDLRASEVDAFMRTLASDQLPFATSLALNWTGRDFQGDERKHMAGAFTIRRKQFAERSVKIRPDERATKQSPEVTVRIDSPGGRSDIFAKFEDQTEKSPFRGRSIAVPTEHVPRTGTGVIRKGWRPSDLMGQAQQHGVGRVFKRRGDVYRGKEGTFLVRRPGGRGTILQRVGDDVQYHANLPTGVRALYQLVPRVRIQPVLEFEGTARDTVERVWARNFTRAFDRATRNMGGRAIGR